MDNIQQTTNLSLWLPTVKINNWGTLINENFIILDNLLHNIIQRHRDAIHQITNLRLFNYHLNFIAAGQNSIDIYETNNELHVNADDICFNDKILLLNSQVDKTPLLEDLHNLQTKLNNIGTWPNTTYIVQNNNTDFDDMRKYFDTVLSTYDNTLSTNITNVTTQYQDALSQLNAAVDELYNTFNTRKKNLSSDMSRTEHEWYNFVESILEKEETGYDQNFHVEPVYLEEVQTLWGLSHWIKKINSPIGVFVHTSYGVSCGHTDNTFYAVDMLFIHATGGLDYKIEPTDRLATNYDWLLDQYEGLVEDSDFVVTTDGISLKIVPDSLDGTKKCITVSESVPLAQEKIDSDDRKYWEPIDRGYVWMHAFTGK